MQMTDLEGVAANGDAQQGAPGQWDEEAQALVHTLRVRSFFYACACRCFARVIGSPVLSRCITHRTGTTLLVSANPLCCHPSWSGAPCPRLIGSCLDMGALTRGGIGQPFHAARHLAPWQEELVIIMMS